LTHLFFQPYTIYGNRPYIVYGVPEKKRSRQGSRSPWQAARSCLLGVSLAEQFGTVESRLLMLIEYESVFRDDLT